MRVLVVLLLVFIQQVSVAKGGSVSASHRVKLEAIFGDKIKYRLSSSTRNLIKTGQLYPFVIDEQGARSEVSSLIETTDNSLLPFIWKKIFTNRDQFIELIATVNMFDEIAQSPEHLEEAKELLIERYGESHGEDQYDKLVDILLIRSQPTTSAF